jgi:hypothetical protein
MKKILLTFALTISMIYNVLSQNKGYELSLSVGSVIPIGDFASKDQYEKNSGYANSGTSFDLRFSKQFENNWGFIVIGKLQFNPLDVDAINTQIMNDNNSLTRISSSVTPWINNGFLFGTMYEKPIDKFSVEGRVLFGYLANRSPEYDIDAYFGQQFLNISTESKKSNAFAFNLGSSLKYEITKQFIAKFNIDIFRTKPEFVNVETQSNVGFSDIVTFKQPINTFNVSIGLGFRF